MKCKLVNENFTSDYTANLMKARGISDLHRYTEAGREFIQSPYDFDNIEEGMRLYVDKVVPGAKILVIVDSDNDGYTSATIISQYTKRFQPEAIVDYRLHDGKQHGLEDHIDAIEEMGPGCYDLVICPDSSSNDYKYHERLKALGIPCLVLDHHITDEKISDNAVIINNQLSNDYDNKELVGAGVTYQFCRALDSRYCHDWADDYLDLAAWGIIGDMGSVLEWENRAIIHLGLGNIKNKLFLALMEKQAYSLTGKTNPSDAELRAAMNPISVAFYIVPLVNAMIRVGTMEEKKRLFEAFLDGDAMIPSGKRGEKGQLTKAGGEAARECTNARSRQNKFLEKAVDSIEAKIFKYDLLENRILFVRLEDDDDFPRELNGLVAMKLSQKFQRPTMVGRLNTDGEIKGSIRGLNQSSLTSFKDFLTASEYMDYVQGHDNAAGFSIKNYYLANLHGYANRELKDIDFGENVFNVNYERPAMASDLGALITDISNHDGIWGQWNPTPLIYIKDLYLTKDDIKVIGRNHDTLRFEKNGITYIKFFAKDLIEKIGEMQNEELHLEVVGEANLNEWMGRVTPQIMVSDIDFREASLLDF